MWSQVFVFVREAAYVDGGWLTCVRSHAPPGTYDHIAEVLTTIEVPWVVLSLSHVCLSVCLSVRLFILVCVCISLLCLRSSVSLSLSHVSPLVGPELLLSLSLSLSLCCSLSPCVRERERLRRVPLNELTCTLWLTIACRPPHSRQIPFTLLKPEDVASSNIPPTAVILVNCINGFPAEGATRLAEFVARGCCVARASRCFVDLPHCFFSLTLHGGVQVRC